MGADTVGAVVSPESLDTSPPDRGDAAGDMREPEFTPRRSRRAMFAAMAAAAAGAWRVAKADPVDIPYDVDPMALVPKLVRRTTMGITQAELASAESRGYDGYLEYQLNYTAIDDSALTAMLTPLGSLGLTFAQLATYTAGSIQNELTEATMRRAIFSTRQLYERMVELWTDHFNVAISDGAAYKLVDDREVIRRFALDTFPNLLRASAHSPAMLIYLNNNTNVKTSPNENYARELMELHTLGVDGGYTQTDVQQVAKCLTGWTVTTRSVDPNYGNFLYIDANHDKTTKTVLGNTIPANGGQNDGDTVLNILINHPNTAKFIAKKICWWLLGADTAQTVIDSVAATYTATGGDIKSMIRTALKPTNLLAAGPKLKRPFHVMSSAMRSLPITMTASASLRTDLLAGGHQPFVWPTPDGYPDKTDYWAANPLWRWSHGAQIGANSFSGLTVDWTGFFSGASTPDQYADRINQRLFAGFMPVADRNRVRDYIAVSPTSLSRRQEGTGLAVGSPGFQWY